MTKVQDPDILSSWKRISYKSWSGSGWRRDPGSVGIVACLPQNGSLLFLRYGGISIIYLRKHNSHALIHWRVRAVLDKVHLGSGVATNSMGF
jgi:hypothetical protein